MRLLEISPLTTSVNAIPWQDYIGKLLCLMRWLGAGSSSGLKLIQASLELVHLKLVEAGLELVDLILVFFQVE